MAKFGINVFLIQLLNVTAFVLLIPEINVFCMAKNIDLRNFEDIEHIIGFKIFEFHLW
jgi:hypothetical protein